MSLKRLRDMLSDVSHLVEATGSRTAAKEVREFAKALPGDDNRDAQEAVNELKRLLDQERSEIRASYAARMHKVATDRSQFEVVYAELKGDKRLTKEDIDAIAQLYIGGRAKWPTKSAALKAIRSSFADRAYSESKMRIVEKSKVW